MKFAGASKKWSEKNLVAANKPQQKPYADGFHVLTQAVDFSLEDARDISFSRSSLSAEKFAIATVLRG